MIGYRKTQSGFTLVEIMIASTVLVLISGAILISLIAGNRSFIFGTTAYGVQQQAHLLMDKMIFNIRQARKIVVAEPTRIEFKDRGGQDAGYYVQDGNLYDLTGQRLNQDVTITLSFLYYDKDGVPVTGFGFAGYLPPIWSVKLSLTATKGNLSMTLESNPSKGGGVALRNVKLIK